MDPVSLGIAAAALLGSKFGEELAKDAGGSAWKALGQLRELVTARLREGRETRTALTASTQELTQSQSVIADHITGVARRDPQFAAQVERLVTAARQDSTVEMFVAQAFDDAKQVNIRGDNSGTINLG